MLIPQSDITKSYKAAAIQLYTIQSSDHDITKDCNPLRDYICPGQPFYNMVQYLGWKHWVWCFESLEDYQNEWLEIERLRNHYLWTLSVSAESVKWCGLNAQCENELPMPEWFGCCAEEMRQRGDIPQALIQKPIDRDWVISIKPFNTTLKNVTPTIQKGDNHHAAF